MIECPICKRNQAVSYGVELEDKVTTWYHCFCGVVFHDEEFKQSYFDKKFIDDYANVKNYESRMNYFYKTYGGIIEELTWGRKFLDVGYTIPYNIHYLSDRGWVATGIDIANDELILGDYESHDFGEERFDCIHLGHVLESMQDPFKAIETSYNLLNQKGILVITTPAPELILRFGLQGFGHCFNPKEKWIFMPKENIIKHAEKCGFKEVLSRFNFSERFGIWNDSHIILQKRK